MNFIDKAFDNKLHGDDFLQAMADVYSETEVREILDKYPGFVKEADVLRQASAMPLEEYEENYDSLCDKLAINNDYDVSASKEGVV